MIILYTYVFLPFLLRCPVSCDHYVNGVKALDPDAVVSLCDSDMKDSSKRIMKALKFTHECLEVMVEECKSSKKAIIGALEGGYDKAVREKEAKLLSSLPLDGYFLGVDRVILTGHRMMN